MKTAYLDLLAKSEQRTVLIAFTASWSGASQMLMHKLENNQQSMAGIVIGELDVDEHEDLVISLGIQQVPTTFIIKNRVVVDLFTGLISKNNLLRKVGALAQSE